MEIKGTAVKSIPEFVKKTNPEKYNDWMNALPKESKDLFVEGIITNQWYDITNAAVVPTDKIADMFFAGNKAEGAWQAGRYSADIALNGIYKLYVKMSSPGHIISRASRVFAAYYQPCEMTTANSQSNSVDIHIKSTEKINPTVENRVSGWSERALEISGCNEVKVAIAKSMSMGNSETVINCSWK